MWLLRPPGVYRPQADTWLLTQALYDATIPRSAQVLDMFTGTGALAVAAVRAGAAKVTAMDISIRATWAARLNTRIRGLPVRVEYGDALIGLADRQFDVVLANPPYVPCASPTPPRRGPSRAWDAAHDGRALINPLCAVVPRILSPGGMLLIVQSAICGVKTTLSLLRQGGLSATVVARRVEPFGPIMQRRSALLEHWGLIEPGQRHEELVVIRGDQPE
ncbi:MAG: methyltransferase, partial [Actinomycetota bacterium]|nr:methyltransferase [Actinomycetota bacterium]